MLLRLAGSSIRASDAEIHLTLSRGVTATDQANLPSTSHLAMKWQQFLGQSFTVNTAGQLVGLEFAPLLDTASTTDVVKMDIEVPIGPTVTVSIPTSAFPPSAGNAPAPPSAPCLRGPAVSMLPRLARHPGRMCFALFIAAGWFFSVRGRVAKILPEPFTTAPMRALPILMFGAMFYWLWRLRRGKFPTPVRHEVHQTSKIPLDGTVLGR